MKKFQDKQYYWVRRRAHTSGEQVIHQPHWEPMLWDAKEGKFYTRGEFNGRAPGELDKIGEIIKRRPPRKVRKVWIPTDLGRGGGFLVPDLENLRSSRALAKVQGDGDPIRGEISWDKGDLREATRAYRARRDR